MSQLSYALSVYRVFAATVVALCAACASTASDPNAGEQVARAVGLAHAIELRTEGAALDAAPATGDNLTLADALRLAIERGATLQAALARVRVALADAQQARLLPNPILSFVLRLPVGGGRAEIDAGVSQELAAILKRPRRVAAADHRLRAAVSEAVSTSFDVVAELRVRYAAVQALDELVPLVRERSTLLDRLVELAQSRLEFGEGARVDVTTLRTQRVELDIELADLELRRREARIALARAIGEPSSSAEWELDTWAALPEYTLDERTWIVAAIDRRPEIQASLLELAALGDDAAIAALRVWDGSSLGLSAQQDGGWSVGPGFEVPIPLFDMGGARRARATAEIVAARHELVDLSRGIVEEVRRALAGFVSAERNLERVRDELIPLQRERRQDVEEIYLAGQTDVTALLLAEQGLQATQAKLVELEERAATSMIRLERAVGGPTVARDVLDGRAASPQPSSPQR